MRSLISHADAPLSRIFVALAAILAATIQADVVFAQEHVSFPGPGFNMEAEMFRPEGKGPFPAVIALHGCAGLYNRDGALSARHVDWGQRLKKSGFVVIMPDSYGSRGLGSQCKVRDRDVRPSRDRVADALAARDYLQSRSDIKADAVSLLGWSNGGSTVLYAVKEKPGSSVLRGFARAVAFYPGCRVPAKDAKWQSRVPLLILIGSADDWTPAEPCEALAERAKGQGDDVQIVTYAGAYHDFDHPDLALHTRRGLAYTSGGSGVAHTGSNPAAAADAAVRVPAFLAR